MLTVLSNAPAVSALMDAAVAAAPQASERGRQKTAEHIGLITTETMEHEIYDQPLPPSYEQFGKFDRTGALLAAESVVERGGESVVTTVNTGLAGKDPEEYALMRHENQKFPAPWREQGLDEAMPDVPAVFAEAFAEAMPANLVVMD